MVSLVLGGAASGKSAFAEDLILAAPSRPLVYAATMEPWGEEAQRRIARHRALRAGKGFVTFEAPRAADLGKIPEGGAVLLECLTTLTANECFSVGFDGAEKRLLAGVEALLRRCGDAVLVSGDLFSDGYTYPPETERYLSVLAAVNGELAARADRVIEVCCSIPIFHKGEA